MLDLVARFQDRVFGLCYRMLGQRQDAEDAAQETFVRVLNNLARWDANRDFEPWLLAIAGNRCRTALAVRARRPTAQPIVVAPADRSVELQAARQLGEEVELALQRIRDEYRQAFVLFHEQELSYEEIAAVMQCPLGTVKTWIHRARIELIRLLREREVVQERRHAMQ